MVSREGACDWIGGSGDGAMAMVTRARRCCDALNSPSSAKARHAKAWPTRMLLSLIHI